MPGQITKYFKDECTKTVMQYIKYETPDVIIQKAIYLFLLIKLFSKKYI